MTREELIQEYQDLKQQLSEVNARISSILKRDNKRYNYSNAETTHSAETQSLDELRLLKKSIKEDMANIASQLGCSFVQMKN